MNWIIWLLIGIGGFLVIKFVLNLDKAILQLGAVIIAASLCFYTLVIMKNYFEQKFNY